MVAVVVVSSTWRSMMPQFLFAGWMIGKKSTVVPLLFMMSAASWGGMPSVLIRSLKTTILPVVPCRSCPPSMIASPIFDRVSVGCIVLR